MLSRILYILFVSLISLETLSAQAVSEELKKIKAADLACINASMNISYNVYTNYITQVPFDKLKGVYKKNGQNYFSDIGGILTVRNDKIVFSVDTISRLIILGDHQKQLYRLGIVDLDTLVPFFVKTTVADLKNGQRMITMVFKDEHEYEKIQLFYNPETYFVNKLILFYSNEQSLDEEEDLTEEKPRLEINYQNINTTSIVPLSDFSEKKYLQLLPNGAIGVDKYAEYEIMDDREKFRGKQKNQ